MTYFLQSLCAPLNPLKGTQRCKVYGVCSASWRLGLLRLINILFQATKGKPKIEAPARWPEPKAGPQPWPVG